MPNFNSIGSGLSEPQMAENRYLPLTGGIALTTVYALTCYTVISMQLQATDRQNTFVSKIVQTAYNFLSERLQEEQNEVILVVKK